jgi:DNA-directed RNA polymerase specialized sigma24 family protein
MTTRWRGTESAPPQTNPDIFATSFRELTPALYDFLYRLSGREETADALIRQVASQAAMSAASATQWPSARAWLFARAYTALPAESFAAGADPTLFIPTDPSLLPPVPPESGLDDMARAVWRAISALPIEQHALLHLHIREAMVGGEAASVLGITERDATDRLHRLVPAVDAASRALFLIRYGRMRDPDLDALLGQLNVTRLTPEARARIEAYAETSPTAQALLHTLPPPLTVYAALRPLPPPPVVVEEAVAGALPWLAVAAEPTSAQPALGATTAIPEGAPYGTWAYGQDELSAEPYGTEYDAPTETVAVEGYGGYGAAFPDQPRDHPGEPQRETWDGTRALDIPVRQRVVQEEAANAPPHTTNRGAGPLALLGILGGALILVVGALVIFLVRGDPGSSGANVTATVGTTATVPGSTIPTSAISPALLTATALASTFNTPIPPPTATTAPRPPSAGTTTAVSGTSTAISGSAMTGLSTPTLSGTQAAGSAIATPFVVFTQAPTLTAPPARLTQIPLETPTPRVTPVPTNSPAPTKQATPATTPGGASTATTVKATTPAATSAATSAASVAATASGGMIAVDKGSVNLGGSGNTTGVMLSNGGTGAASFTAKANTTWLSVSPVSGSVPAGGTLPATISVNRSSLIPGQTYSGTVTFTTASGHSSIVTVTITA